MQRVKPGEIDIAAIHDINGAGFGNKQVERMHVVQFTVGDVDEAWDISLTNPLILRRLEKA
jgi:hypothetical protein